MLREGALSPTRQDKKNGRILFFGQTLALRSCPRLNPPLEQSGDLFAELLDLVGDLAFQPFDSLL